MDARIDVRDFIQKDVVPHEGDAALLAGATRTTDALWAKVNLPKASRQTASSTSTPLGVPPRSTSAPRRRVHRPQPRAVVRLQTDARR